METGCAGRAGPAEITGEHVIAHHRIRRASRAALLGAAALTASACSVTIGTPGGSAASAGSPTAAAAKRPLPPDAIVPVDGADLCTLLGPDFLGRFAPGYTLDNPKDQPLKRPEYRRMSTERGGTGPELTAGGCQVSTVDGLGTGIGVSLTRELPGPNTTRTPEDRCALVSKTRYTQDSAETATLAPDFTFEDMPALGPGGFRELEVRDGKVLMARVQGCHGPDWVFVSIVPATGSDGATAANDAVTAIQEIYRRLGDV